MELTIKAKKVMTFALSLALASGVLAGTAIKTASPTEAAAFNGDGNISSKEIGDYSENDPDYTPALKDKNRFEVTTHAVGIDKGNCTLTYDKSKLSETFSKYGPGQTAATGDNIRRNLIYVTDTINKKNTTLTLDNPFSCTYSPAFNYNNTDYDFVIACTKMEIKIPDNAKFDTSPNSNAWLKDHIGIAYLSTDTNTLNVASSVYDPGTKYWSNQSYPPTAGTKAEIKCYIYKTGDPSKTPVDFNTIPSLYISTNDLDQGDKTITDQGVAGGEYAEGIQPVSGISKCYVDPNTQLKWNGPDGDLKWKFYHQTAESVSDSSTTKLVMVADSSGSSMNYNWYGSACVTAISGAFLMYDTEGVTIQKKANYRGAGAKANVDLKGVKFEVTANQTVTDPLDSDKTLIKKGETKTAYTDENGEAKISGLPVGSYTVTEMATNSQLILPTNTQSQDFSIDYNSNDIALPATPVFTDDTYMVRIRKVDENGRPLSGGHFAIIDPDDGKTVVEFDTPSGVQTVSGLEKGKQYYLRELTPPSGYDKAKDVPFTAPTDDTVVDVKMKDEPADRDLTMSKTINANDVDLDHGAPTFFLTASGTDTNNVKTYRTVSFNFTDKLINDAKAGASYTSVVTNKGSHRYKSKNTNPDESDNEHNINAQVITVGDGKVTISETVKMRSGTYLVNEIQPARYAFEKIDVKDATASGQTGNVDLISNNWGRVSYTDKCTRYDKWSHRDTVRNHFETTNDDAYNSSTMIPEQ